MVSRRGEQSCGGDDGMTDEDGTLRSPSCVFFARRRAVSCHHAAMSRTSGGSPRARPSAVVVFAEVRAAALAWGFLVAAFLLAAFLAPVTAHAAKMALLVGVTEYPNLPPALQLKAPVNDVRLMRTVLRQRGFVDADIETLADGVEGAAAPTRAAILAALGRTAQRARPGDTVYLHFSGHGSLQRTGDPSATAASPAGGWQPVFLPRDVRGWDGKRGAPVPNAITDTVMREAVDAINAKGAFVFAVFDACHSARLVRGVLPHTDASLVRVRQVEPAALGMTHDLPQADVRPPWFDTVSSSTPPPRDRGRAVYFYAAQSYEMATSLPLPVGDRKAWHGLFTWHLARALALGEVSSHRQLGQHLLSRHDQWPAASALPLFGGDGLDDVVFGQTTATVQQWPLERHGTRAAIPAGALSGLGEGALVALLADPLATAGRDPTQPPAGTLGYARVKTLEVDRAWLEPVSWQGFAPPSIALMQAGTWARVVSNPAVFALRISIDSSRCPASCPAARALAALRRDGVIGVDARWVDHADAADVRLRATERGVQVLLPGAAEEDGGRSSWGYAAPATVDAAGLDALVQQTAAGLHRVARTRNLLELAARVALREPRTGIRLDVKVKRRAGQAVAIATTDRLIDFGRGDELILEGRNMAADPHDLVAFWLGADQSIARIYPVDRRDVPRLAAGQPLRRAAWSVDDDSEGTERLLVITMPMRRANEAADFRFLEQSPLTRLRGATPDADLQALLDACLADYRSRGDPTPAPAAQALSMQVYTFRITTP